MNTVAKAHFIYFGVVVLMFWGILLAFPIIYGTEMPKNMFDFSIVVTILATTGNIIYWLKR